MAFMAVILGLGLFFYILSGLRQCMPEGGVTQARNLRWRLAARWGLQDSGQCLPGAHLLIGFRVYGLRFRAWLVRSLHGVSDF